MNPDKEFRRKCARLVARTALDAAESMDTDKRIMIQQGIMELFPKNSREWSHAHATAEALLKFKDSQLRLFQSLDA